MELNQGELLLNGKVYQLKDFFSKSKPHIIYRQILLKPELRQGFFYFGNKNGVEKWMKKEVLDEIRRGTVV